MKRVVVGGFHHESDTFNPIITGKEDIRVSRGEELLAQYNGGENALSGIVSALKGKVELIPTVFARAVPGGVWDKAYYLSLKEKMLALIKESEPFDAFALALHGSMRVQEIGDAESDLLSSLKSLYPDIPIFASLDMHATITEEMIRCSDALVCYKCAPHTDTVETGQKVGKITLEYLQNGELSKQCAVKIPFLVAGEQSETNTEPMRTLIEELRALERDDEKVISASYAMGFPWADVETNGCAAIVVSKDVEYAKEKALALAKRFWSEREDFKFCAENFSSEDAISEAVKYVKDGITPVVISDSGDNPTAGSSQDVTSFLELILQNDELKKLDPPLCYNAFYDPELVALAFEKGIGNTIEGYIGAKFDKAISRSLPFKGVVKALSKEYKFATLALLDIEGVYVVVSSKRMGCYECDAMRVLGVDVEHLKVLVVKLGYLEPELKSIAKKGILALTRGSSDELFTRLTYKNLPRPIYPIDKEGEFTLQLLVR